MRTLLLVCLTLIVLAGLTLTGCPKPKPADAPSPGPAPETKAKAPSAEPAEAVTKAPETEKPAAPAKPGSFTWTETPTLDKIPAGAVKGMLNGKPFEAKTVLLDHESKSFKKIRFSSKQLTSDSDLLNGDTAVNVFLPEDAKAGLKIVKPMGALALQDGIRIDYYYPAKNSPASVSSPWALALSIDSGEKKPYDPAGNKMVQLGGSLKGRIALCFKDQAKSWIAGNFDAKIRYFGQP